MINLLFGGQYMIFALLLIALVVSLSFMNSVMRWWPSGMATTRRSGLAG